MSTAQFVQVDATEHHGTALIAKDDSVWVVLAPRTFASWLWWWLAPSDRKVWVVLNATNGGKIRARAIRVAQRHVRIKGNV